MYNARCVRARYALGGRGARARAGVLALVLLGGLHECGRTRARESETPAAITGLGRGPGSVPAPQPLWRPAAEPDRAAPDVAILMLACIPMQETTFALSLWGQVRGIARVPFYVSVDCSPGIALDDDEWRARGLRMRVLSSHQRADANAARRDERVTRHWLHAVTRVLSRHEHVLYVEDDHVVLPEILGDAFALLALGQRTCPYCFAVQLGCHGDCWGAATADAGLVGLMEPGNMGVVYSRDKWRWFTAQIAEFCRPYGIWDVNLHLFLEAQSEFKYALTFLKTRIYAMPTCRSSRTHMRGDCDWAPVRAAIHTFIQTNATLPRISATALRVFPHTERAARADAETFRLCVAAVEADAAVLPPRAAEADTSGERRAV